MAENPSKSRRLHHIFKFMKKNLLFAAALLVGMTLASCGNGSKTAAPAAESTETAAAETSSETEEVSDGENKDLDGSDVVIKGDDADCISVVPGNYTLNYTTPPSDINPKYNNQNFKMKLKIQLNSNLANADFRNWPKVTLLNSDGGDIDHQADMSMTKLDREKFKKFLATGKPGDTKEFTFTTEASVTGSISNEEFGKKIYADATTFLVDNITNTAGQ